MFNSVRKELSRKYCPRFGEIAIELGFLTEPQLAEALALQFSEGQGGRGHRLLGAILFDNDMLSAGQVDEVATELFRRVRSEQPHAPRHPPRDCSQPGTR